ncbi:MAG: transcriptional repressor LexA [Desulfomonile sp.]|nr:transcriptional repressor LexA [Desulfomonile sp.]
MRTLTKKQKQVLDFIVAFIGDHGFAPSYDEIASGVGLSSASTVHAHVENLVRKGHLIKKWGANRSLDLPQDRRTLGGSMDLPLVGRVAAGRPIEAVEQLESIAVPPGLVGKGETFVLQVTGDSMIDSHVVDGDYVLVEKTSAPRDGDTVVALIRGGEATLKRYRRVRDKIWLEPANPAYEPIIVDEADVTIQGIVVGILRKYRRH